MNTEIHRRHRREVAPPHELTAGRPHEPGADHQVRRARFDGRRWQALVVEDDRSIRESLQDLLAEDGYDVLLAENGNEALRQLHQGASPDVVVLDLRMPVMDGWEFRAIQRNDESLKHIPVIAISADGSPQALAISAEACLRKPLDSVELPATLARLLRERELNELAARLEAAEHLASLGRIAAGVGHEINNPLSFVMLNVKLSLTKLRRLLTAAWGANVERPAEIPPTALVATRDIADIAQMLEETEVGIERIRQTVLNLRLLSRRGDKEKHDIDIEALMDQSISMAWNQILHRARLARTFTKVPPIHGDAVLLGQVFLNLLVNAAQAIPEGAAERNEIVVSTALEGERVVVEIRDSGEGIDEANLPHIFEPFFTTKAVGIGTGLGLSICRETILDHGGTIEVESKRHRGTTVRVVLPAAPPNEDAAPIPDPGPERPTRRGRVLVIDDEILIGRVVQGALREEHDVTFVARASDALAALASGQTFDLVLCDLAMPDMGGPAVLSVLQERWPSVVPLLVFMTGGAFTPALQEFVETTTVAVIPKPFSLEDLRRIAREHALARP